MRRFLKILKRVLLALLILIGILFVLIQIPAVQTYAGKKVAEYLSKELKTEVSVEKLKIDLWDLIHIENLLVKDLNNDTLMFIEDFNTGTFDLDIKNKNIKFSSAKLLSPKFFLSTQQGDSINNLRFLVDYFSNDSENNDNWVIEINDSEIVNGEFQISDFNYSDSLSNHFNSRHIALSQINGRLKDLNIIGDNISSKITQLNLIEKSGIRLADLNGELTLSPTQIALNSAHLEANESNISGDFKLNSKGFQSFSNYLNEVSHNFNIVDAQLSLNDIGFFIPDNNFDDLTIDLSANLIGKINRLKIKDIKSKFGDQSKFDGSISMRGLPNIKQASLDLDIKDLSTNQSDLDNILIPAFVSDFSGTPENLSALGTFSYSGELIGYVNDFVTYGALETKIGTLETDLEFKEVDSDKKYAYSGKLKTNHFDLGKLYSNQNLGPISSDIEISGMGITRSGAELNIDGIINSIELAGIDLTSLEINGNLKDNFFSGKLDSHDPQLNLDFIGDIDLQQDIPQYSFTSNIRNLDPKKFNQPDFGVDSLSGLLTIDASGFNLDNIQGEICLEKAHIHSKNKTYDIGSAFLHSSITPERIIILESDILDADIVGEFSIPQVKNAVLSIAQNFSPEISVQDDADLGDFEANLRFKSLEQLYEFLPHEAYISEGSRFNLEQDSTGSYLEFISSEFHYDQIQALDLKIDFNQVNDQVSLDVSLDELNISDSFVIREIGIKSDEMNGLLDSQVSWNNGESKTSGIINFQFDQSQNLYDISLDEGEINLGPVTWLINGGGKIFSTGSDIAFNSVDINSGEERIFINGSVNDDENTNLLIENLDISAINYFTPSGTAQLSGTINGLLDLKGGITSGQASSNLTVSDLKLDDISIGDIISTGKWVPKSQSFHMDGKLVSRKAEQLSFSGDYFPLDKIDPLNIMVKAEQLNLEFMSTILRENVSDFEGTLSGEIAVTGELLRPKLKGFLDFNNAKVKVNYLNTTYALNESIELLPDMFILNSTKINDEEGNEGFITGSVFHDNFRDWNYDIFLDIEKEPFLCLNTSKDQNDLFYGKAYGKGFVNVGGYGNFLEISANASSQKGTVINMPLGDSEDVHFEDFVSFVSHDADSLSTLERLQNEFDLFLNLEIDITEDADFKLIFDQATGDVLNGSGRGHLSMLVENENEFKMYGSVEVVKGDYLFTLQNLINKEFTIKPGGTITWYGDPFLADIDLETAYNLTAPLYDLLGSGEQAYNKRIPVELIMDLEGKLMNPGIRFDINLPSADDITKSNVNGIINTDQEMNKQAFSLLVMKKFLSTADDAQAHGGIGIAENSSEFLSSQLTNWLSQITDEVDIGLNYRPGDEITSQEIALALSTQLFNDKLYISGNLGLTQGNESNHNPNTIIGDVRLEYLLGEDGKIRLLVYNESDSFDVNTTNYENNTTQGLGFIYKEDFDSWLELTHELRALIRKENNDE